MNFWGAEIEAGKVLEFNDSDCAIAITQIAVDIGIGEGSVVLYATVDGIKRVIGTLSHNIPQMKCEIFFTHEFTLSHSHDSASVYVLGGYKDLDVGSDTDESDSDDPEDELANYEQEEETEEEKEGVHTATPHPAKKGGKNPMNANQGPKSGGQSSSGNKKQFNSGKQLGSNNKGNKGNGKGRA
ncbi:hypothetical protein IGI04_036249 [Brassica rapa subsp. trilocularis]|uniref:Nucleoplasmin-like domain-containing protein n=1 Tax=Brassica rapa subsp. trilocularis TaxID=1813537 RepID=A0ABQ7LGY6_BRACM|nr:hypothetical protein IGI04_036249 [Brassica rapa subsp. trilocularis]